MRKEIAFQHRYQIIVVKITIFSCLGSSCRVSTNGIAASMYFLLTKDYSRLLFYVLLKTLFLPPTGLLQIHEVSLAPDPFIFVSFFLGLVFKEGTPILHC